MVKNIRMYMDKKMAVIELKSPVAEKFAGSDIKVGVTSDFVIICE
jgi:hypothetical protein